MVAPLLSRKFQAAFKIEGTAGTAESLGNADVAYLAQSPTFTPQVAMFQRPRNGNLGQNKAKPGARMATLVLTFELAGKGASGTPHWADLLQCCAFSKSSNIYTASSDPSAWKTATAAINLDGVVKQLHGAMGTFTINIPAASGGIPTIAFTMTGILDDDADAAAWTNATPVLPPVAVDGTFSIDAYEPLIGTLSIDAGNAVTMRPDHRSESGYALAWITDQNSTVSVDPEMALRATYDPWAEILAATEHDIQYVLNGGANNTITIDIAKAQPTNAPTGDRNGNLTEALALQVNEQAFVITFS